MPTSASCCRKPDDFSARESREWTRIIFQIPIRGHSRDSRANNSITMILARVEGSVVATKKNPKMTGSKFLVVRPLVIDSPKAKEIKPGSSTLVAVDSLGAGEGDCVLVVQGSSARLAADDKDSPVDAVIIGIVDTVDLGKTILYKVQ
jgi:ethanolamine utilization protein EutN